MAERCSGILAGSTPGFGSGNPGDPAQIPAELLRPYMSGGYYPETFAFRSQVNAKTTSDLFAVTNIGPLFCAGARSWDRVGMIMQFNSSPGTPPDFYFVVYELDPETLFPVALLFQGAVQTQSITLAFHEETIALTTSADWIGIGWHCTGTGSETYAIRAGGDVTGAGVTQGYAPYGHTRVGTTFTPRVSLYATQTLGTATAAAPSLFTATQPASVPTAYINTGVYMMVA